MPTHRVTKIIEFCYGHRLIDHKGSCRYLHGHNGLLEVVVESDSLDDMGVVMDFATVRDLVKGWVDENIDHRMILYREDRVVPVLTELGEPLYLMDENPTAENIAKHIYEQVCHRGLNVSEVRLWETPSSYTTYRDG